MAEFFYFCLLTRLNFELSIAFSSVTCSTVCDKMVEILKVPHKTKKRRASLSHEGKKDLPTPFVDVDVDGNGNEYQYL